MTVYMVSIRRIRTAKNAVGMDVNESEALGNTLFEGREDAEFYAAQCVALGIDAFVFPRQVVPNQNGLAVAS